MSDHLTSVQKRIYSSCSRSYREPTHIELIAVSKGQTVEKIRSLYDLGVKTFGENYVQELCEKAGQLADLELRWVFLGRIQSNKIKKMMPFLAEIQSVSSIEHALLIDKEAAKLRKADFSIYILVNAGDEAQKDGVRLQDLESFFDEIRKKCAQLRIRGIMSIPPLEMEEEARDKLYSRLRKEAGRIGEGRLSLGMSSDLELAIKHGSDTLRIGTDLFGIRHKK